MKGGFQSPFHWFNLPWCKDALALLAAFLPADLIDFVFELLSEPFGVWISCF